MDTVNTLNGSKRGLIILIGLDGFLIIIVIFEQYIELLIRQTDSTHVEPPSLDMAISACDTPVTAGFR